MKVIETHPREIGFVLRDHCQNLLDDPRKTTSSFAGGICKQLGPRSGLTMLDPDLSPICLLRSC